MSHHHRRLGRLSAGTAVGALVTGGLFLAAPSAHAADEVAVASHTVDLTDTRATGHNEFRTDGSGVRVWTEGATSTDKAAGYFDAHKPLAAIGEPSMTWTPNGANTVVPGKQLKVDFDNDGTIDGILVGEPTKPDGSVLYGNDWWLNNAAAQFVKDAAPSHTGGFGSDNHGTLAEWRTAFPNADVIQAGWSLGSGVKGDGVIHAFVIGGQPYYFVKSDEPTTIVKYESDVDLSETRPGGHNDFRAIGGVRVHTDSNTSQDKAAGYFPAPVALADAGEPSMDHTYYSGTKPSVQLVTDFNGDGTSDGILVGETIYGHDWWLSNGSAQFVKDGAPSHTGGSGSENHGLLSEWRANFPNAKIVLAGWSLGSGVQGDGVINSITVGLSRFTFSGANRAPVAPDQAATTAAGTSVQVTLAATDPDGDALTFTSTDGTVAGNKLTYAAPKDFVGTKVLGYTVTDGNGGSTHGTVTVTVTKAASTTTLKVSPRKVTTKSKHVRGKVSVTSTGVATGGTVDLFDGDTKIGTGVLGANGMVKIKVTSTLAKGKHTITAVFAGTGSTLTSEASVVVKVKNHKKKK
ncbi:Ig-like domain-containing protein [Nocardioides halotolerans]|uniref:Ig-like domain-containing protein n=1 Tax=Nocardioides halotolerans TaxID=433660 RepID=UPI0003F71AB6|nr:Ig-like domain-containing protein [Nocardioides halotolerans]